MSRRSISEQFVTLREAAREYLSECDNPVPDYGYRKILRDHLRKLVGASDAPPVTACSALSKDGAK